MKKKFKVKEAVDKGLDKVAGGIVNLYRKSNSFNENNFFLFSGWFVKTLFSINLIMQCCLSLLFLSMTVFNENKVFWGGLFSAHLLFGIFGAFTMWRIFGGWPERWSMMYGAKLFWSEYYAYRDRKQKEQKRELTPTSIEQNKEEK